MPVLLTVAAGVGWAVGNICSRQARAPKPLHLTLWMSVVPPVPLLALSLLLEGPRRDWESLRTAFTLDALPAVLGLLYIVVVASLVGYGLWNTLLARNATSVVAPFAMLVPVVGVLSAWLFFDEVPGVVELVGGRAGRRRGALRLAVGPHAGGRRAAGCRRPARGAVFTCAKRRSPLMVAWTRTRWARSCRCGRGPTSRRSGPAWPCWPAGPSSSRNRTPA